MSIETIEDFEKFVESQGFNKINTSTITPSAFKKLITEILEIARLPLPMSYGIAIYTKNIISPNLHKDKENIIYLISSKKLFDCLEFKYLNYELIASYHSIEKEDKTIISTTSCVENINKSKESFISNLAGVTRHLKD